MVDDIKAELQRLGASDAEVALTDEFEPKAGELVRFSLEDTYWHLTPEHFLSLLKDLPDGAGTERIRRTIEENAQFVWHGPSPKGSRDT